MQFLVEDTDDMWLTQVPSLDIAGPNFGIGDTYYEEELVEEDYEQNVISLEENFGSNRQQVLYDNVVCENISSDEEVDAM